MIKSLVTQITYMQVLLWLPSKKKKNLIYTLIYLANEQRQGEAYAHL